MIVSKRHIKIYPGIPIDVAYGCVKDYLLSDRGDKLLIDSLIDYTVTDHGRGWRVNVYQTKTQIVVRGVEVTDGA